MQKLLLILIISSLISCSSNTLDKPFKKDKFEEDFIALRKSLSEEEFNMLSMFVVGNMMDGNKFLGKTYGDILDEAIDFTKEEERKASEAKQAEEEKHKKVIQKMIDEGLL